MTTNDLGQLSDRLRMLAQVPVLLVASDYDGVLAPLVDDPMEAKASRQSVAALRSLAETPNTHVAVVSGRSLRDLVKVSKLTHQIRLVGSHGGEFDSTFTASLSADLIKLRDTVVAMVEKLGEKYLARTERKPTGATFHFRGMDKASQDAARDELIRGPVGLDGVHTRSGHDIIEMSVIDTNKGLALDVIRTQVGASAVLFLGDDVTDEDGFRTLHGPDVGVKVGGGSTAAEYRVPDTATVSQILALLSEFRTEWLNGAALTRIENHSILSDLRTAAVVSPDANIVWMCAPRIDSAAVFSSLLGGQSLGHFSVSDAEARPPLRQYYGHDNMVLHTEYPTFTVTDYLDTSAGRTTLVAERTDLIRVIHGSGIAHICFTPRQDFGRVATRLEVVADGLAVRGSADELALRSPGVDWDISNDGRHHLATAHVNLGSGPVTLELRTGTESTAADPRPEPQRRAGTEQYWSDWLKRLCVPHIQRDLITRSAMVLKSLCHEPTGAIVTSVTSSLPNDMGGRRNWDQRYCWLRDGALASTSLTRLGSSQEALAFLDWVATILDARTKPDRLAPVYNVTGRHLPPEAQINTLPGYGGSRPVRVGHAAEGQIQLDMFGPLVNLVCQLLESGAPVTAAHWHMVESMVAVVSRRWQQPDKGIWQTRLDARHNLHTKVMCWVAVDRAIKLSDKFLDRPPAKWIELRTEIETEVLVRGWNRTLGSFSATYDGDQLDSSALSIGLWGLVDSNDERFVSTVDAIERELLTGPVVHRYHHDDGLPGRDGGHMMMTSWLIDALALTGRVEQAMSMFEDLCQLAGNTGICSEQYDPGKQRALGNIPSCYAHVGLINNALTLDI